MWASHTDIVIITSEICRSRDNDGGVEQEAQEVREDVTKVLSGKNQQFSWCRRLCHAADVR